MNERLPDVDRLTALEERVAALEQAAATTAIATPAATPALDQRFWVLNGLKEQVPPPGAVVFAGAVEVPAGPVEWQYGALTTQLLDTDWAEFARNLAAIGNPIRLSILQAVINGASTVAELGESANFGTSGQIYHHVNTLTAAGWLVAKGKGRYHVPPERVVPLLVILTAAGRSFA